MPPKMKNNVTGSSAHHASSKRSEEHRSEQRGALRQRELDRFGDPDVASLGRCGSDSKYYDGDRSN